MNLIFRLMLTVCLILLSEVSRFSQLVPQPLLSEAHAAGSSGKGKYFGSVRSYDASGTKALREVDGTYEYGKSLYRGELPGATRYNYCVYHDGKKVPIKRRTLKQFKKASVLKLASSLYDCDRPDILIGFEIPADSFQYVIYYLNKRYNLKLSQPEVN